MEAICPYCDKEFDLTPDDVDVNLESDHPFINLLLTIPCPHCGEKETCILALNDFLQERDADEEVWDSSPAPLWGMVA